MSDITDAGARLKAMNDALERISDRPQPINIEARLAALQRLVELEEELGLPRTPHPLSTPSEGSVQGDGIPKQA